jgi:hypothetical protein
MKNNKYIKKGLLILFTIIVIFILFESVIALRNINKDVEGIILFTPFHGNEIILVNEKVESNILIENLEYKGGSVKLLSNGNFIRAGAYFERKDCPFKNAGGYTGILQEITSEGEIVWEYVLANDQYLMHHDFEVMDNGNYLVIAFEKMYYEDKKVLGDNTYDNLLMDVIFEIDPQTNEIVWEWHEKDHLIQEIDENLANYGIISENPQLLDIYYRNSEKDMKTQSDTLRIIHYSHINNVSYNEKNDEIVLSARAFSEIWIIDHSTTTEEATSHNGGDSGNGGDILYRYGNPSAYGGSEEDRTLFGQHDAHYISDSDILIFNNGIMYNRDISSVDEIHIDEDNSTTLTSSYILEDSFAHHMSSAQKLSNGNLFICDGPNGNLFEVTEAGEIVLEYDIRNESISSERMFNAIKYNEKVLIDYFYEEE